MRVTGSHKYVYVCVCVCVYIYIYIYIYLSPSKKCISQGGKIVNEGVKFIFRDIAKQVGEHTEKLLRSKQGREAHQERKRVGVPYGEEEPPPIFRIAF